jgi:hypothetical protein
MREAGLTAGDDVRIRAIGPGRVELVRTQELIDLHAGILDSSIFPDGYLDEVRRGWA